MKKSHPIISNIKTMIENFLPFTNYDESIGPFKLMVHDYLDGVSSKYRLKETKIRTRYYKKSASVKISVYIKTQDKDTFTVLTFGLFSDPLKKSDQFL